MKIEIINLQDNEHPLVTKISLDEQSDYQLLVELLKQGDIIEKKIRRKSRTVKNHVNYFNIELIIEQIEYITNPTQTIHIIGEISDCENPNIKEGSKQSIWLTDGCEFKLTKVDWDESDIDMINEIINPKEKTVETKIEISPQSLQEKCFDILHKYLFKKFDFVIYGNQTFDALENGAIKILLVTEEFIQKQTDEWKEILASETHKYHGANIVIYNEGTTNWEELTGFGGIIGVLKYNYEISNDTN